MNISVLVAVTEAQTHLLHRHHVANIQLHLIQTQLPVSIVSTARLNCRLTNANVQTKCHSPREDENRGVVDFH